VIPVDYIDCLGKAQSENIENLRSIQILSFHFFVSGSFHEDDSVKQ